MSRAAAQFEALRQKLDAARKRIGRPLLERFAEALREEIARSFARSVSPAGTRWAPRARRGGRPLVETGELARSFEVVVRDGSIEVLSSLPRARILQARVRRGTKRLPARIIVPARGTIGRRWLRVLNAAWAAVAADIAREAS